MSQIFAFDFIRLKAVTTNQNTESEPKGETRYLEIFSFVSLVLTDLINQKTASSNIL